MVQILKLSAAFDDELEQDASGKLSGSGSYNLVVDDVAADQADILNLTLVAGPAFNLWTLHLSAFPGVATCLVRKRRAVRIGKSRNGWRVECDFDEDRIVKSEDEPDPRIRDMKVSCRTQFEQRPAFADPYGAALVNAAGSLYAGQTTDAVLFVYGMQWNTATPFDAIGKVAGYTNSDAVPIYDITWPPQTLRFFDYSRPDEISEEAGIDFWPNTGAVMGDPDGHYRLLPNRGFDELIWEVKQNGRWISAEIQAYNAVTNAENKRIRRARIKDDENNESTEHWLDQYGRAVEAAQLVPSIVSTTGTATAGSASVTVPGGSFDSEVHTGAGITIYGAGFEGRPLITRIKAVTSATAIVLEHFAWTAKVANAKVELSGVIINTWDRFPSISFADNLPAFPA